METIKICSIVAVTAFVSSVATHHLSDRAEELPLAESAGPREQASLPQHSSTPGNDCAPREATASKDISVSSPASTRTEPPASPNPSAGSQPPGESPIEMRRRLRQQQEHIDRVREFVQSHESGTAVTAAQSKYESETVDYDWALQKEDELLVLFNTNDELAAFAPLDLSCKSVNCRVVMAVEDNRQANRIYRSLLTALTRDDQGQTVSSFNDPQSGQLVMYVSTDGGKELFSKD